MGETMPVDGQMDYNDAPQAWQHWHEHENKGPGVILTGHSQG